MLRRRRFSDVVERQLDIFEREHGDLIADCAEAERAYDRAPREEAEERYGDYLDLVAAGAEALAELRDAYAATLDDEAAVAYATEFDRAVAKRLPPFGEGVADA